MNVTVISIIVGSLGLIPNNLKKYLEDLEIHGRTVTVLIRSVNY